jgi:hypothetical protein
MFDTILKHPKAIILPKRNLLETFGCVPGPAIRENARLMMRDFIKWIINKLYIINNISKYI